MTRNYFFPCLLCFIHLYVVKLLPKLKNCTLCMKIQLSIQVSRQDFRKKKKKKKSIILANWNTIARILLQFQIMVIW